MQAMKQGALRAARLSVSHQIKLVKLRTMLDVQANAQGAEGCDLARVLLCPRTRNLWFFEGLVTCCALGVLGVRGPGAPLTTLSDADHTGTKRGYSRTCRRSRRGRKASTLNPQPSTLYPSHSTLHPPPSNLHPQPSTLHPSTSTLQPPPSNVQAIAQGAEGCDLARVLFCPRARNLWPLEGRVSGGSAPLGR